MADTDLILLTKLQPPQLKAGTLRRERLLNLLKDNLDKKLIVICADAGYGKTTLITQFLFGLNTDYVYYNLSQTDADPHRFFNHLTFGLQKISPQFGERANSILKESSNFNASAERILTTFANETLQLQNTLIILDDFHTIKHAQWVKFAFDYLLMYLPSNIHFIVSSREVPDFNLARLFAKRELFKLTKEDLRFTNDELKQLLGDILSADISDEQIRRLVDVSQGWITGIQLVLPKCPDDTKVKEALNGFLATNESLFDYFANEILVNEDESIKKFLMSISILDEVYPEYCNAITGTDDSLRILKQLERRNIFIYSIGREKNHFRLHPLFRKFLQCQLDGNMTPPEISVLYRRVGKFCEKSHRIEDAIEYYIRGKDHDKAALLIEKNAEQIILRAGSMSLYGWLSRIPTPVFAERPWLCYYRNFLLDRVDNRLDEALDGYLKARRLFKKKNDHNGFSRSSLEIATILCRRGLIGEAKKEIRKAEQSCLYSNRQSLVLIFNIKAIIAEYDGKLDRVDEYLHKMSELARALRQPASLILAHCNLGVFYTMMGDFNAAESEYEKGLAAISGVQYQRGIGLLYANAAFVKIRKGKLKEADALISEGIDICTRYNNMAPFITLMLVRGDLRLAEGDLLNALEDYRKALALAIEKSEEQARLNAIESLSALHLKKNDIPKAHEYYKMLTVRRPREKYARTRPGWVLLDAKIKLAQGKAVAADAILKKLLPTVEKKKLKFLDFETNLNLACLHEKRGKNYAQYLGKALRISKDLGYENVIMKEERYLALLRKAAGFADDEYARAILSQAEKGMLPMEEKALFKIRVNFFGVPEVLGEDGIFAEWISEKAKKLFCFFIINQERRIPKEEIIETFWPGLPLAKAENNLSSTLYYIRKALIPQRKAKYLKEMVLYRNRTYYLDPGLTIKTDVKEFEGLINEIKIKKSIGKTAVTGNLLERVISLYRGHFCSNWYDPWIDSKRITYENIFLKALHWAVEEAFDREDYERCLEFCNKAIAIDQYSEEMHYFLIRSLLAANRRAEALSSYNHIVNALKEAGMNPSPRLLAFKTKLFA